MPRTHRQVVVPIACPHDLDVSQVEVAVVDRPPSACRRAGGVSAWKRPKVNGGAAAAAATGAAASFCGCSRCQDDHDHQRRHHELWPLCGVIQLKAAAVLDTITDGLPTAIAVAAGGARAA